MTINNDSQEHYIKFCFAFPLPTHHMEHVTRVSESSVYFGVTGHTQPREPSPR
jgi:hypothetical protein